MYCDFCGTVWKKGKTYVCYKQTNSLPLVPTWHSHIQCFAHDFSTIPVKLLSADRQVSVIQSDFIAWLKERSNQNECLGGLRRRLVNKETELDGSYYKQLLWYALSSGLMNTSLVPYLTCSSVHRVVTPFPKTTCESWTSGFFKNTEKYVAEILLSYHTQFFMCEKVEGILKDKLWSIHFKLPFTGVTGGLKLRQQLGKDGSRRIMEGGF